MFAAVIRNYTKTQQTDFKTQSNTEGLGFELLCREIEKFISQAQTAQSFVDGVWGKRD